VSCRVGPPFAPQRKVCRSVGAPTVMGATTVVNSAPAGDCRRGEIHLQAVRHVTTRKEEREPPKPPHRLAGPTPLHFPAEPIGS